MQMPIWYLTELYVCASVDMFGTNLISPPPLFPLQTLFYCPPLVMQQFCRPRCGKWTTLHDLLLDGKLVFCSSHPSYQVTLSLAFTSPLYISNIFRIFLFSCQIHGQVSVCHARNAPHNKVGAIAEPFWFPAQGNIYTSQLSKGHNFSQKFHSLDFLVHPTRQYCQFSIRWQNLNSNIDAGTNVMSNVNVLIFFA